ncbi:glycoside hydrolase family 88 protein [Flammeovirga aprica]|uniref:Glucuronyl hydrolase n=1 Tax=Flammeovirga aprica JL-4 TaxID=694437 RepID=A0A7X9NZI9_9BACT|nr:glycoside hydrolase family 88 protein [Flammeovirga aprica]NME66804.1 glucuronyl hydrolase [Flammeovirga aprica JL-4]
MRFIVLVYAISIFVFAGCQAKAEQEKRPKWLVNAMSVAALHLDNMKTEVLQTGKMPRSKERGLVPIEDWTSGFYAGSLWYMYEYTGEEKWAELATQVTDLLEDQKNNRHDHDVGFRIFCSFGNGYRLKKDPHYKEVIITASESLGSRFNSTLGLIRSWDDALIQTMDKGFDCPVIIDNMMNLEMLYAASRLSKNNKFHNISVSHADKTLVNHYREDYSCPHVVDYDKKTGKRIKMTFNNGYNETSAWSRGQGWGLYGYTMSYRATKDTAYLKHAEKIASFIINNPNLPKDRIPYWDYRAPETPTARDASAAALNASALLELSLYSENGEEYFKIAEEILRNLSTPEYLAKAGENGHFILKHATGNFRRNSEVDNTLSYADYYYLEAILRYLSITENKPFPVLYELNNQSS